MAANSSYSPFAYKTVGAAVGFIESLSRANINVYGGQNVPKGPKIFVINHFTRIETLLLPYHIHKITNRPVWSLGDKGLFVGALKNFLNCVGCVSTADPDRDRLIIHSLLKNEADWIIFPEAMMVKSRKIMDKGKYMIVDSDGNKVAPRTGAASLALRADFYRERLYQLSRTGQEAELKRLLSLFNVDSIHGISRLETTIVPVNVSYYPMRARENMLSRMAKRYIENIPERALEEMMTEGSILAEKTDIDIRFGVPIEVNRYLAHPTIVYDIQDPKQIDFDDDIPSRRVMRDCARKIMNRYMNSIYSMTTVNHDHIFAAMIQKMPKATFTDKELQRRVFWLMADGFVRLGTNPHKDLDRKQIHLLTDDAYHKYRNFIKLAEQTGVIKREGCQWRKNSDIFTQIQDFHRVRVDNPISVIANSVEPLKRLQKKVYRIAWMPEWSIRRKIAKRILAEDIRLYHKDYKKYYDPERSKDEGVGLPRLYKGGIFKRRGVLLLHGYGAGPREVGELAEYLNKKGYWVYTPRLRGHGTSPWDLAKRRNHAWVKSAKYGYALLDNLCDEIYVCGFSMGAGVALRLAQKFKGIRGLVCVNPAFCLRNKAAKLVTLVNGWNTALDMFFRNGREHGYKFVVNDPEHPEINYFHNPVAGIRQLKMLMTRVEAELDLIKCPILIVQASNDNVVDPKGARMLFDKVNSRDKSFYTVNADNHGILMGKGSQEVFRHIAIFLKSHK